MRGPRRVQACEEGVGRHKMSRGQRERDACRSLWETKYVSRGVRAVEDEDGKEEVSKDAGRRIGPVIWVRCVDI